MQKIEFKIQNLHRNWETTPVSITIEGGMERSLIDRIAMLLSQVRGREVRWNYAGSPQGHYKDAEKKRRTYVDVEIYNGAIYAATIPEGVILAITNHDTEQVDGAEHTELHDHKSPLTRKDEPSG